MKLGEVNHVSLTIDEFVAAGFCVVTARNKYAFRLQFCGAIRFYMRNLDEVVRKIDEEK